MGRSVTGRERLRRWLVPGLCESPLRLRASRLFPNRVDCLAGGRVRKLGVGFVLRGQASRSLVSLHVRVRAWDHLPVITVSHVVRDRQVGRRGEAGHEFGWTDSGHDVTDLSGQVGLGFGRLCWSFCPRGVVLALLVFGSTVRLRCRRL